MKLEKEHQIIMLPSENKSTLYRRNNLNTLHLGDFDYCKEGDTLRTNQHLYILSDEEIKKGDWIVEYGFVIRYDGFPLDESDRKIIATTDIELHYNKIVEEDMHMYKESLPHIPQHIIEAYVKKPFDKVMVEYTEIEMCFNYNGSHYGKDCSCKGGDFRKVPKTDSNNCIIIHPVEEKMIPLSKVKSIIRKYENDNLYYGRDGYYSDIDIAGKWIKENL